MQETRSRREEDREVGVDVMVKKYRVGLTGEEQEVRALVSKGRAAAYKQTHARIPRFHEGRLSCSAMRTSLANQ